MLFATYKRPNESAEFRFAFNEAKRSFLEGGRWPELDNDLAHLAKRFPASALHIAACRTLSTLYSCTDPAFGADSANRLAETIISGAPLHEREGDIHHDAYCILRSSALDKTAQAAGVLKEHADKHDYFANLEEGSLGGERLDPPVQTEFYIPRTGFFSFLEQLCLATFVASYFDVKINVNLINWMFPNNIADMLPSLNGKITYRTKWYAGKKAGKANVQKTRQSLFRSPAMRRGFASWKQFFYRHFLGASLSYLRDNRPDIDLEQAYGTVIFLRFGDKIAAETFPIHANVLAESISRFESCTILSDDQTRVEKLIEEAPDRAFNTLYGRHISGYDFNKSSHNIAGFEDVLVKWCIMAKAETLHTDCNTNIANAAFAANSATGYASKSPLAIFRPTLLI